MRLVILGNSGSGKSTYARRAAAEHGLAHLELDGIVFEPHQINVPRPIAAVNADLAAFIAAHDRWVIEGCYADLATLAAAHCTELIFLNPGVAACVANNRARPYEPHKFDSPADQERMLAPLLAWVEAYPTRTTPTGYPAHRAMFEAHPGPKRELTDARAR